MTGSSLDFEGLEVVVTGATGALGRAVVSLLLDSGAECRLPVREVNSDLQVPWVGHERVRIVPGVDLTDERDVVGFYSGLSGPWASIHCAGGFAMKPLVETGLDEFERQIRLNLVSCFLCCRESARVMTAGPSRGAGGRIVNVASRSALEPRSGGGAVPYTVAKAGIAALTESLAAELAGDVIWVNAVAPSIFDTPANRKAMPGADQSRWPATTDVAETILFLASPRNRSTSGAVVPVYGRAWS